MAIRDRISRFLGRANTAQTAHTTPLWVRAFTAAGRPLVAIAVLGMCAPGEHHLAELAGWSPTLAWGMAAVLAAYAGIAAAVAGARPAGAPGKRSAVAGAVLSLTAAMAAQPLSHLFVTGWLTADPRPPLALVIGVSCVPPLVLGHLLHLAATPIPAAAAEPAEPREQKTETPETDREHDEQDDEPDRADGFLTTAQVAARYGVAPSTIGTWLARGKIEYAFKDPALGNMYDPRALPTVTAAG